MSKKRLLLIIIPAIVLIAGLILFLTTNPHKSEKNERIESEKIIDTSFEDEYHFDTDFQYYMTSPAVIAPKVQETGSGCVMVHNGFVYTYLQGGSIVPLCSKVNCIHDREPDPDKRRECHACLDDAMIDSDGTTYAYLMAYKDSLYVVYDAETGIDSKGDHCLARLHLDGSSKEVLLKGQSMECPLIHRGYLYYFTLEYAADSDGIKYKASFHRMNIEKSILKDECLFNDGRQHGFTGLRAYGSYIWFMMVNGGDILSQVYDIRTGTIIPTDLQTDGYQMYQDKLYRMRHEKLEDNTSSLNISEMDITGKPGKTVLTGIEPGSTLQGDKNYIYISDAENQWEHPETEEVYKVYDKNFNLVDSYRMPNIGDRYISAVPVGGENYQYLLYTGNEAGKWGLLIFDKKEIGSIKGELCPYNILWYGETSPEPFKPEPSDQGTSERNRIPEPTLDSKTSITYSEITDELFTGKLKRKRYADYMVDYDANIECQVSFTQDQVSASVTSQPVEINPKEGIILLGTCNRKITKVYGYYTKGEETYVRTVTMSSMNTTEPDTVTLELPEDGDEFIGVKAEVTGVLQEEHWSYPEEELIGDAKNPSSISSQGYSITSYDGMVCTEIENKMDDYELGSITVIEDPEITYIGPLSEWPEEKKEQTEAVSREEGSNQYAYGRLSMTENRITCTSGCSLSSEYNEMTGQVIGYYVSGEGVYRIELKGRKSQGKELVLQVQLPEGGEYFLGAEGYHQVLYSYDENDRSQTIEWSDENEGHTYVGQAGLK